MFMEDQYQFVSDMSGVYSMLQDKLSQDLFWGRLKYDVEPSLDNAFQMVRTATGEPRKDPEFWSKTFDMLLANNKKIILYGPGPQGREIAGHILGHRKDFCGFCGRNFERYPDGIMGKPVYPPQYLLEHMEECYVILSTTHYYAQMYDWLIEHGFPSSHILLFSDCIADVSDLFEKQYFDFPELYESGTAFVDAGCFDCRDSVQFVKYCKGAYSRIFAFEPDIVNFNRCKLISKNTNLQHIDFINAGLGRYSGAAFFDNQCDTASHIVASDDGTSTETIQIVALDEVVGDTKVGFIKMDIEGAEYDALLGAEHILLRDKPLLAICIYHKRGDMLAIMTYLHQLIPEYRFWIRHYSVSMNETVLYAAIPCLEDQQDK